MIKIGSFISQSEHKDFINQLNELLIELSVEQKHENVLVKELMDEKDKLEELFFRYKILFNELPALINEYKLQKVRTRKKLRIIQIGKK